jgi:hypothetical protein
MGLDNDLSHEDRDHIRECFQGEIVPKLSRLHARIGTLNCSFAGERYRNWCIRFKSSGSGFEIVEFECDDTGEGIDLDL